MAMHCQKGRGVRERDIKKMVVRSAPIRTRNSGWNCNGGQAWTRFLPRGLFAERSRTSLNKDTRRSKSGPAITKKGTSSHLQDAGRIPSGVVALWLAAGSCPAGSRSKEASTSPGRLWSSAAMLVGSKSGLLIRRFLRCNLQYPTHEARNRYPTHPSGVCVGEQSVLVLVSPRVLTPSSVLR